MVNFIKKIFVILLSFCLIFTITACGDNNSNDDDFVTINASKRDIANYLKTLSNGEIILEDNHYDKLTLGINKQACESEGNGAGSPYSGVWNIDNLTITGTKNVIVDGFTIDIDSTNVAGKVYEPRYNINTLKINGITMYGPIKLGYDTSNKNKVNSLLIENLIIEDVVFNFSELASSLSQPSTGWKIESAIYLLPKTDNIKNVTIKNCTFTNMNDVRAVVLVQTIADNFKNGSNVTIENCSFDSAGYNPIQFAGNGHDGNITIKNCTFSNNTNSAIRIAGATGNVIIQDSTFSSSGYERGVYISGSDGAEISFIGENVFNGKYISLNGQKIEPIN